MSAIKGFVPNADRLPESSVQRIESILRVAVNSVIRRSSNYDFRHRRAIEDALSRVVQKRCLFILAAAEISPARIRRASNWEDQQKQERARIAAELRDSRLKLRKLHREIENAGKTAADLGTSIAAMNFRLANDKGYPAVPPPVVAVGLVGDGLPEASGVYFAWRDGIVQYVGQSISLKNRCKLGHHALIEGDQLSWLEFPKPRLNFAESFYIGTLFPSRNFGSRSTHSLL